MNRTQFIARSLEDTDRLGRVLAEELPDQMTVALCGTLGAGKTRLVQAIAAACGVPREQVVSPTFVLSQEYSGTRRLFHFDAYRLESEKEFRQLGPEEYFEAPGLTFVEWGDRVVNCLPADRLEIHIELGDDDERRIDLVSIGSRFDSLIDRLADRLS